MILTCPDCATSYFVDEGRIPPQGRKVRCSACGHRWTAGPDGPTAEASAAEPPPAPGEAAPAPGPEPEPEPTAVESAAAEPEPVFVPRRPVEVRRTRARGASRALIWAGAAALAAALIAGAIIFREQVVRIWPQSSAAYAGLGLGLGLDGGLVLEAVNVKPAFLAGRPVLSVTGAIRNVRDAPATAPPVRLTLLNRQGEPVAAKIARPQDPLVPAGARRHFAVTLLDPPATARDLEVRFENPGGRSPRGEQVVLTPAPTPLQAPAPPEAVAPGSAAPATEPLTPAAATEHG